MSTAEKLRSKHIRTLEALSEVVRTNESLQQKVAELQHALDLRNAHDQTTTDMTANTVQQEKMQDQLEKLDFDNQQLAKQTEASVAAMAKMKSEHEKEQAQMRKEKYALTRKMGETIKESEELKTENDSMREEFVDLRGKAKKAWELEVSNRSQLVEIQELKEEIERLKSEETKQREAYVLNLKQTEKEASIAISIEIEKTATLIQQAVATNDIKWQAEIDALNRQIQTEKENVENLEQTLSKSNQKCLLLENRFNSIHSPPKAPSSPRGPAMVDIEELEKQILLLTKEIKSDKIIIDTLKKQLANKNKEDTKEDEDQDQGFGKFVKIKRENQVLRAQIKDLMQTQARILGGSSARRVEPGGGRRRRR